MATSITFLDDEDLNDEAFLASVENDTLNYAELSDESIGALVDGQLLTAEAAYYINQIYVPEDPSFGLASTFSDRFFSPDLAISAKFASSLSATAGSRWSEIKAKARKIACQILTALGADVSIKELIKKTLEKLKESILGGLPKLLVAIIVGVLSFAVKKGFDWLCVA